MKAKDEYWDILQTITLGEYSTQNTSYTEVASWNFTSPWYVEFSAKIRSWTSGILTSATISINWETFEDSTTGTAEKSISYEFGFQNKSNYSIKLKSGNSVRYAYINTIQMVVYANKMLKSQLLLEPSKIGWIWDLIIINLYWMDDGVYKWWIITGESTEVWTWSITLWNAVWFLEINYNWKIVKVPYYD